MESIKGPTGLDIVRSGLEETMVTATKNIVDIANNNNCSLRLAAWMYSIQKVANIYEESGISI
jgi:glutamate dehydrogenase (NAD(P)+)